MDPGWGGGGAEFPMGGIVPALVNQIFVCIQPADVSTVINTVTTTNIFLLPDKCNILLESAGLHSTKNWQN